MKTIHIFLEETEYEIVTKLKGERTWREFVMEKCKEYERYVP